MTVSLARKMAIAVGLCLWCALPAVCNAQASAPLRTRYNFNPGWRVYVGDATGADRPEFDDSAWKVVTTPYAWNEDSAFKVCIHDLPTGVAWYRKHFRLPAGSEGKKVFVEFEGIRQDGEIYLNGTFVGRHEDGVMAFGFDLSALLKPAPAENVLAVRTDNRWDYRERATNTSFQWNNANFYANYGGISKNVWLHAVPKVYQTFPLYSTLGTTGTYVYAGDFDLPHQSARVTVESQVRNETTQPQSATLSVRVTGPDGALVKAFTSAPAVMIAPGSNGVLMASSMAQNLHFWSWGYGYLYDVSTTVMVDGKPVDAVTTRTGFRKTAFHDGTIYLNDRVLQVHGYAQRTTNEWPGLGIDVPPWVSDFSNRMMVESNGNLVRWMHVTPSKQDVESSDRVGLIQSMPAGDAEGDPKGRQWEQRVELMRDSVIYNRNNPSILFYESGNKGVSDEHMQDMKRVRDSYDPHGGRASGSREMLASDVAEYGGEMLYINKSATKPLWAHEYSRDEGARKFWDGDSPPFHKDSPLYNRDQASHAIEDVRRWFDYWRERPGTGTRVSSGGVNIIFADSNTHYRGDNNYRRSGEVDGMRIPKDGFFAHQAMWNGWVDVEHPGSHILGHWNYGAGTVKPVYVVSTADKVELKLNGHSLGFGAQTSRFLFTFDKVRFEPGRLEATGFDAQGRVVTTARLRTAGTPVAVRLTPHTGPGGLRADGADLALVDVEVVDAEGSRCPTALDSIHFELRGAAEWRGGIAQGSSLPATANTAANDNHGLSTTPPTLLLHEDNFILAKTLPVEGGVNRVSLRSTTMAGTVSLTATAAGLKPATLTLTSIAQPVADGLSTAMPAAGLVANLERGPTPSTPSFRVTRKAVPIVSATAGTNRADARLSIDDNEITAWSNETKDTKASTEGAWIEYSFVQAARPVELTLKLGNFRVRRYPIRVTLDGVGVWEGLTPTSLGYVTLPLKPATGKHLRIALTSAPVEGSDFAGIVEITGKIDQTGEPAGKRVDPVLNVIEAEIYAAP